MYVWNVHNYVSMYLCATQIRTDMTMVIAPGSILFEVTSYSAALALLLSLSHRSLYEADIQYREINHISQLIHIKLLRIRRTIR